MSLSQVRIQDDTNTGTDPTGFDRLVVGSRQAGTAGMVGWVRSVKIYNKSMTAESLGADLFTASANMIMCTGQSNADGYFRSDVALNNDGEVAGQAMFDTVMPGSTNYLMRTCFGGSEAIHQAVGDNWWYDPTTDSFGPRMQNFLRVSGAAKTAGITPKAIIWDQGEADQSDLQADYVAALIKIFSKFRATWPTTPIIQMPIGRSTNAQNSNYQKLTDAKSQVEATLSYVKRGPEKLPCEMAYESSAEVSLGATSANVHLSGAGYTQTAPRVVRKALKEAGATVSGPVDGSTISNATITGTTITVTLTHPTGITDFAPTTGIEGFTFFDGVSTTIAVSSAVRTSATTITLTLASTPTAAVGTRTLYYGYGSVYPATRANLVVGNDANALPLQRGKFAL